jgi:hypothetical protein
MLVFEGKPILFSAKPFAGHQFGGLFGKPTGYLPVSGLRCAP